MPIIEQISRGLSDFTARYVMSKQDAIIHTSVEIQMDADDWTRCESDIDLDKADEERY